MADQDARQAWSVVALETLELEPSRHNQGVRLARITGEQVASSWGLYTLTIDPACQIADHDHPLSETFLVVEGVVHCVLSDTTLQVGSGEVARFEEQVVHSIQNRGDSPARLVTILSPDL